MIFIIYRYIAITSTENPSQPPLVPSVWNHLVAINAWLGNVRNWQGQNPEVKVIPVQITDRAQKQRNEHRAITLGVETEARA